MSARIDLAEKERVLSEVVDDTDTQSVADHAGCVPSTSLNCEFIFFDRQKLLGTWV